MSSAAVTPGRRTSYAWLLTASMAVAATVVIVLLVVAQ